MPNERLRDALLRKGFNLDEVAAATAVDRKTVERWITQSRVPYSRHRHTVAALVQESENYLWPDAVAPERKAAIGASEVIEIYPHRHSAPYDLWSRLIDQAQERVEILVYSAMFLTDDPTLVRRLRQKSRKGTKVRLVVGDPTSREVAHRSIEEGIGKTTLAAKVRNALAFYRPLDGESGIEIRCHATTLYNSLYRFDDDMLVNTHVYGFAAAHAPLIHLRRLTGGDLFEMYADSFENVWSGAKPPKWP
ncbi:XRE family transcriptional regulator [Amycolatopsis sp. NPDC059027]|uniref:XRE family transcriptional regulator n=1 Tax=Amycolatopsis sp. NPDC059027 TaxID=3346709 RepID=UPI00366A7C88